MRLYRVMEDQPVNMFFDERGASFFIDSPDSMIKVDDWIYERYERTMKTFFQAETDLLINYEMNKAKKEKRNEMNNGKNEEE